jgi:hypothetical protein
MSSAGGRVGGGISSDGGGRASGLGPYGGAGRCSWKTDIGTIGAAVVATGTTRHTGTVAPAGGGHPRGLSGRRCQPVLPLWLLSREWGHHPGRYGFAPHGGSDIPTESERQLLKQLSGTLVPERGRPCNQTVDFG